MVDVDYSEGLNGSRMAGGPNLAIIFGSIKLNLFLDPQNNKKELCSFVGGPAFSFPFSFFLSMCVGLVFFFFRLCWSAIFRGLEVFGKDLSALSFRKHRKEN